MENQVTYKLMRPGEEETVINIVTEVFDEFVAPQYSEEGITEFYKYVNAGPLAEHSREDHFTLIAGKGNETAGIIEIRDNNHISLFFVKKTLQKKGLGKKLLQNAIEHCFKGDPELNSLTVNASPNAVKAYEKMGFTVKDTEQCINGIKFVPMCLKLKNPKNELIVSTLRNKK